MQKKLLLIFLLFTSGLLFSQDDKAINSINQKDLRSHLEFLASDELEGRITPSYGCDVAAKYIAVQFQKFGLKPIGDSNTYFQNFTVYYKKYIEHFLLFNGKKYFKTNEILPPIIDNMEIPSKEVKSSIVFVGYGITEQTLNYDDYAGIDVKDKIVMFMRGIPGDGDSNNPFKEKKYSKWTFGKAKFDNAKNHGAAGSIIVGSPNFMGFDFMEVGYILAPYHKAFLKPVQESANLSSPLAANISEKVADEILHISGKNLKDIKSSIQKSMKPSSFEISELPGILKFEKVFGSQNTKNVIGLIEGSDPELKNEVIVVGSHYDHVGTLDSLVFNGADDDASGTVGVIELARIFSISQNKPKRSILFVAFTGEEQGLYGSNYYVSNPIYPLNKIDAMIQLDMISRDEDTKNPNSGVIGSMMGSGLAKTSADENTNSLYLYGLSYSKGLKELFLKANKRTNLNLKMDYDETGLFGGSDHIPFYQKKIPVCFFNTGLHPDLHLPTDDIEKINFPKMEKIVKLAYYSIWEIANKQEKMVLDKKVNK